MKEKANNQMQPTDQASSVKKATATISNTWEMSAQEALRVDYLTNYRKL